MKVVLVDDHNLFRQGLATLLEREQCFDIVGQSNDGEKAVSLIKDVECDLIIMDIAMPLMNGIEAARLILQQTPQMKIIVLSAQSDAQTVREALKAGVQGYVHKSCSYEKLKEAISVVSENRRYLSPVITHVFLKSAIDGSDSSQINFQSEVTEKENQIIRMLVDGMSIKQIALEMKLSPKTVDAYRRSIMEKLNLDSIVDLVKWAIREGIADLCERKKMEG